MNTRNFPELCLQAMLDQKEFMQPSKFHSWKWARPDFQMALEWLESNPNEIVHGENLNDTPGSRVWRIHTPNILGNFDIIYKLYESEDFLGESLALKSVLNSAALNILGISTAPVLACGETRNFASLKSSFLVTQFLPNRHNGTELAPAGSLREQRKLRMMFCKKLMEQISMLHQCRCRDSQFRAKRFLFKENTGAKNSINIDWIDPAYLDFNTKAQEAQYVPQDLIKLFVDLRLTADEIKALCKVYIECWPSCEFTIEGIWQTFTKMKPIPLP